MVSDEKGAAGLVEWRGVGERNRQQGAIGPAVRITSAFAGPPLEIPAGLEMSGGDALVRSSAVPWSTDSRHAAEGFGQPDGTQNPLYHGVGGSHAQ